MATNKVFGILKGTCPYVIFFGFFVGVCLLLQCFIPFIQRMAELSGNGSYNWSFWLQVLNTQFVLPMELISQFWAAIAATYVGLDRTAFAVDAFKHGTNGGHAFNDEKLSQLNSIIWLSFGIFILATLLNTFFQAELALAPLFACFGATVLFYVGGNKSVRTMENICPEEYSEAFIRESDLDLKDLCEAVCKDETLTDDDRKTIIVVANMLKRDEPFTMKVCENGKIQTLNKKS